MFVCVHVADHNCPLNSTSSFLEYMYAPFWQAKKFGKVVRCRTSSELYSVTTSAPRCGESWRTPRRRYVSVCVCVCVRGGLGVDDSICCVNLGKTVQCLVGLAKRNWFVMAHTDGTYVVVGVFWPVSLCFACEQVVRRCWAGDPDDRPTAHEALELLKRVVRSRDCGFRSVVVIHCQVVALACCSLPRASHRFVLHGGGCLCWYHCTIWMFVFREKLPSRRRTTLRPHMQGPPWYVPAAAATIAYRCTFFDNAVVCTPSADLCSLFG